MINKTVLIIPARFGSSRYRGKPLVKILGKPMIQWTAEISAKAVGIENVFIATENTEIELQFENCDSIATVKKAYIKKES